jgi:hypothetical protein
MKKLELTLDMQLWETLKAEARAKGLTLVGYIRMILIERKK